MKSWKFKWTPVITAIGETTFQLFYGSIVSFQRIDGIGIDSKWWRRSEGTAGHMVLSVTGSLWFANQTTCPGDARDYCANGGDVIAWRFGGRGFRTDWISLYPKPWFLWVIWDCWEHFVWGPAASRRSRHGWINVFYWIFPALIWGYFGTPFTLIPMNHFLFRSIWIRLTKVSIESNPEAGTILWVYRGCAGPIF